MPTLAKRCCTCKRDLPLESFHKNRNREDGHSPRCKECVKKHHTAYRQKNADKMAAYQCEYRKAHVEKLKAKRIEYCRTHKAEKAAYARANAEAINARRRARRAEQRNLQSDGERQRLKAERKAARDAKQKAKREAVRAAAREKQSKVCPCCDVEKPLEEFGVSARYSDGRNCWCRACVVEKVRAYQKAHKEKVASYRKKHKAQPTQKSISQSGDHRKPKVQNRGSLRTNYRWKFQPCQVKPSVANLKEMTDQELLDALLNMPTLTEHIRFITAEATRRPAIYDDLMRLALQHDPSHQKAFAASW